MTRRESECAAFNVDTRPLRAGKRVWSGGGGETAGRKSGRGEGWSGEVPDGAPMNRQAGEKYVIDMRIQYRDCGGAARLYVPRQPM